MLITLNSGKTVSITWEKYDRMTDQEFKNFMEDESGEQINNPFLHSQIDTDSRKRSSYNETDYDDGE